ncbi:MAG: LUD domain-containing protein [Bdellovibrionota bacterium]
MESKEIILDAIRRAKVPSQPHPGSFASESVGDNERRFIDVVESVGGKAFSVRSMAEAETAIRNIPVLLGSERICSCVAELQLGVVQLEGVMDERELDSLDGAIVSGELAVAENGAVWVNPSALRFRSVLFLAAHLVLVVPRNGLVGTMNEAYERLDFRAHNTAYFISGPTKTADIEQNLVIGAQGPRTLHVFLVGE